MWQGDAMTLRLPLKDLKTMGGDCLVAIFQVENAGPILGAAPVRFPRRSGPAVLFRLTVPRQNKRASWPTR